MDAGVRLSRRGSNIARSEELKERGKISSPLVERGRTRKTGEKMKEWRREAIETRGTLFSSVGARRAAAGARD